MRYLIFVFIVDIFVICLWKSGRFFLNHETKLLVTSCNNVYVILIKSHNRFKTLFVIIASQTIDNICET